MRFLTLPLLFTLFAFTTQAQHAATVTGTSAVQQDATSTEVRAMSGSLKEALGQVTRTKSEMAKAAAEPSMAGQLDAINAAKTELGTLSGELEAMLTTVNTASPEAWPTAKASAEALLAKTKGSMAQAKKLLVADK